MVGLVVGAAARAVAQDYGIEFVTVGAPGNPAFNSPSEDYPNSPSIGRGRVDYEYRIGRYEITTAQYLAFANVAYGVPDAQRSPFLDATGPGFWGATTDSTYTGPGERWVLDGRANAAVMPVFGLGWRDAALYVNWLHNGQSNDPASILTGAYDTSTWGRGPGGSFTDARTHLPGARFWIPTLDEQMKAMHYDPNRAEHNGWWLNKNRSDSFGTSGPPGVGTTSAGWDDPVVPGGEYDIPLGAYPNQLSPWGLLDTSGGTIEWNEAVYPLIGLPEERGLLGSGAGLSIGNDSLYSQSSRDPFVPYSHTGIRIASATCCPADLDTDGDFSNGMVRDGAVTIEDFVCFLRAFEAGAGAADLDDDGADPLTPDGGVDVADLIAFLVHFERGC